MAITHDATTNANTGTFASSLTFSHTCAASAYLLIGVVTDDTASHTITSVTYAGAACTELVTVQGTHATPGEFHRAGFYEKTSPATGANDVVITPSEEMLFGIAGSATSRLGVDSAGTPVSAADNNYNATTDPSVTGIGAGAGELSVDLLADQSPIGGTYTAGAGQTERANIAAPRFAGASEKFAVDTMTWSNDVDRFWPGAYVALKLIPAATARRLILSTPLG